MPFERRSPRLTSSLLPTLLLLIAGPATPVTAQDEIIRGPLPPMPPVTYHPQPEGYAVQEVATGLEAVWSLQFTSDGRLFATERPGRVRVVSADGTLDPEPWLSLEDRVFYQGESGLTGLLLHPGYPETPYIYLMYTVITDDGPRNRLSRFTEENGRAGAEKILLDGLPAQARGGSHSGGTLRMGPDGKLYVATGDAFERQRSDDLEDPAGAVLRLNLDGSVPDDNPWPGNPIWAHGLRNVHGIAWQPGTGHVFAADHGPTGEDGLMAHDRVIVLEGGRHHGWPHMVGAPGLPEYVDPILTFAPNSSPPGDVIFYDGDLMPELQGDLFVSVLGFQPLERQNLMRIRFQDPADPTRPTAIERWFNTADGQTQYGRLRALTVGPEGAIYVGTSNRDGRQFAADFREAPDRILRIVPDR